MLGRAANSSDVPTTQGKLGLFYSNVYEHEGTSITFVHVHSAYHADCIAVFTRYM